MRILITILLFILGTGCCKAQTVIFGVRSTLNLANAIVVCDGNSLTRGYRSSNPPSTAYPFRLSQKSGLLTATVYNKGVDGQTTAQMQSDASTDIDPLYNGSVASILVALEVGNHLYFTGDTALVYTTFKNYCLSRKAAGWKVIVCTPYAREHSVTNSGVSPAGDNDAVFQTKRLHLVNRIRNEWRDYADALVDMDANTNLATYNTTYWDADKVHLNDAGYQLMADLVYNILIQL